MTSIIDGHTRGGAGAIPRNPYIAGRALADARGFFGREDIFRLVETVLAQSDQNAIVLFGQRRIGKTSVLLRLRHHLPSPPFRTVYFDLMDRARKPLGAVVYELAATIAAEFDMPQPEEGDFLASVDRFQDRFLPPLLEQLGRDVRPVILFDEFDVLDVAGEENLPETAAARAFFPFLRSLMERERRLAFVFVVGRKAEDLSINVKATFKAARYQRISILDFESARELIGLAERDGSLRFTPAAVDRLLSLTARHPYFTQLMCQLLFDQAYAAYSTTVPTIDVDDVEGIITKTLEAGENIFEWVWDGLPPAERVIFSAVAEVTGVNEVITEEQLSGVLQRHGIRILIRELELAPKTLIEWEMLRRVDGGYGFLVDLMRRWVALRKPLPKVKDELDRINPIADQQYHLGYTFYRLGNLAEAVPPLKAALQVNPNHLKARLLLGEALREQGLLDDSVKELEEAYRYDEDAARYPLVRGLLVWGEEKERVGREEEAVSIYERILSISPRESLARERWQSLLVMRGDRALAQGDYDGALRTYEAAGADTKIAAVIAAQRTRALETFHTDIARLIEREDWEKASAQYRRLIELDPQNSEWPEGLARVERQAATARRYAEALGAVQQFKLAEAQRALADIVGLQPDYKDAAERLAAVVRRLRESRETADTLEPAIAEPEDDPDTDRPLIASSRAMMVFSLGILGSLIAGLIATNAYSFGMAAFFGAIAATLSLVIVRARGDAPAKYRGWVTAGLVLAVCGLVWGTLSGAPPGLPFWVSPLSLRGVLAAVSCGCLIVAFTERRLVRASPILAVYAVVALQGLWWQLEYNATTLWQVFAAGAVAWVAWMAAQRWQSSPSTSTACAAWGAALLMLAMTIWVSTITMSALYGFQNEWVAPWHSSLDLIATTTSQWLIALSVWSHPQTESTDEGS